MNTIIVLISVPKSLFISFNPILTKSDTIAAKTADKKANSSHSLLTDSVFSFGVIIKKVPAPINDIETNSNS